MLVKSDRVDARSLELFAQSRQYLGDLMGSAESGGDRQAGVGTGLSGGTAKRCVVCGVDCAGKPRVKDPNGRYYCKACHDDESARRTATAPSALDPVDPFENVASLASLAAAAPVAALPSVAMCPGCNRMLTEGAVVCMSCGFDQRSRRATTTRVQRAAKSAGWLAYVTNPGAWIQWVSAKPVMLQFAALFSLLIAVGLVISEGLIKRTAIQDPWNVTSYAPLLWLGGAGLYWVIGPLWYRLRLRLAAAEADVPTSRLAYFSTAVPALLWMIVMALAAGGVGRAGDDHAGLRFMLLTGPSRPCCSESVRFSSG
ncbi:MAG: hypothetical protein SGJ11_00575 [Phycisphaerae bacterium]|nr:hypothetical protein [Phycisphaerae bacterium]